MRKAVVLAGVLLVSGWLVSSVVAQSTAVAPFVREVNSDLIHDLIEATNDLLDALEAGLNQDSVHDEVVGAAGPVDVREAVSDVSANTAVADGDAVRSAADLLGRSLMVGPCDRGARVGGVTTVTGTTSTSAIAAGGAGVYNEVWDVIVTNTSATATSVEIEDGNDGTILAVIPAPANDEGRPHRFSVPLTSSANTAIHVDAADAVTSLHITLRGCKAK